jgi:hypothetical protein
MSTERNTSFTALRTNGESLQTEPVRWLHVGLLVLALSGWLTFILACVGGPAWNSDSSKVLFGWHDHESSRFEVAVYDRATRQSRIIFQHLALKQGDDDF